MEDSKTTLFSGASGGRQEPPNQTATENTHDTTTSSCVANSSETHTGNPVAAEEGTDETSVEYVKKEESVVVLENLLPAQQFASRDFLRNRLIFLKVIPTAFHFLKIAKLDRQ